MAEIVEDDLKQFVTDMLNSYDDARPRSLQQEIGPSSVGGCHRRLWHELAGTQPTNEGDKLAAILGTFIHKGIEAALRYKDPWGHRFEIEVEAKTPELLGHIDAYDNVRERVIDWKTIKKGSFKYFGTNNRQHVWQVQLYGWLLKQNDYEVKEVSLVGIPRDGRMSDMLIYKEPYSPEKAEQALTHLQNTKELVQLDSRPNPEKPIQFCADFCPFYDPSGEVGCPSTVK